MKAFFLGTFLLLLVLSALAWSIAPQGTPKGKTPLVRCSDDNPLRAAQHEAFNRLFPQFDLQLDPSNSGMEKVIVQSIGGIGPDLFDCYSASQLSAYVRAGIAWDVTDELKEMGIDVAKDTWSVVHPTCIYEGRVYGCPVNAAANGIWYHKEILQRAGVTPPSGPWQWERDFVPLAQKLTVRSASGRVTQWGFMCDWENEYLQFISQWGGRMYSPDGTRCVIDSKEAVAAIQFMLDLIYRYRVSPSPVDEATMAGTGGWGWAVISYFGAKRTAMALGGRWWLCTLRQYPDLHLGATESPYGTQHVFLGYGKSTLINRNSPRRKDALNVFRFMQSEDYNKLINRQADAICPVIRFAQGEDFLHAPDYPEEDFNQVWRDLMVAAVPEQGSPFINGHVASRLVVRQLEMVKTRNKSAADALRDAARAVNKAIAENLEEDPELKRRYEVLRNASSP